MDLLASPPFRTASLVWQPRPGAHVLTVICKATFTLQPSECVPAPEDDPPNEVDDHWDDDVQRSLHAASDLVPFKRHADVLVVGHAYAPRGRPVSSLVARVVFAGVDKSVEARADRVWTHDGQLREGAPFTRASLRWERAAGGPETPNPVGVRTDGPVDRYGQLALPNLQPPGFRPTFRGQPIPPVGLGPLAPWWPSRLAKLHRHAPTWDRIHWPERPLPEDVDAAFFNAAPPDQQAAEIRADDALLLENLHPDHAYLSTRLPGLLPRVAVTRGGAAEAVRMRCDTLSIDTDRGVCSLVWRGQVALARADERGRVFVTVDRTSPGGVEAKLEATMALGPAMPEEDFARMTLPIAVPISAATLPFQEGSPWSAAAMAMMAISGSGEARGRAEDDGTGTLLGSAEMLREVLPFATAGNEDPEEQATARVVLPRKAAMPVVAAPVTEEPVWEAGGGEVAAPEDEDEEEAEEDEEAGKATVAPPAMIGPLARAGMGAGAAKVEEVPAAAVKVEEVPAAEVEVEAAELPIERVAEIQAELAEERAPRGAVLERHELSEAVWTATERHWAREMEAEAGRGSTRLRRASDAAYVGAVEQFRGPITGAEYARIMIGLERGRAEQELEALRIQKPALMRIVRVWTKKVAGDVRLGREVRGVMAGMREG